MLSKESLYNIFRISYGWLSKNNILSSHTKCVRVVDSLYKLRDFHCINVINVDKTPIDGLI